MGHGSYKRLRRNETLDVRKRGSLCRTRMEGTHSTERREPNTTSICRRDCLKGGDHGQCSTPEKHATQTGGLPPVRNRTHTPNSPGQHTSEHSVEGWLKFCCDTHPQTCAWRAGAAPFVYQAAPSQRAQTSAPLQASNTAPCYQAQGHCTALACALLHLLPRTHTCQLQLQLQHMLIQLLP
jgi:hypothetical protein